LAVFEGENQPKNFSFLPEKLFIFSLRRNFFQAAFSPHFTPNTPPSPLSLSRNYTIVASLPPWEQPQQQVAKSASIPIFVKELEIKQHTYSVRNQHEKRTFFIELLRLVSMEHSYF